MDQTEWLIIMTADTNHSKVYIKKKNKKKKKGLQNAQSYIYIPFSKHISNLWIIWGKALKIWRN